MRTATINRHTFSTDEGTFGDYLSDTGYRCVTLERAKTGPFPCIPAGVYKCELRWSNKHKARDYGFGYGMVYGVKDVKGRTDILLHPANFAQELQGCIALGMEAKLIPLDGGFKQMGIVTSRVAVIGMMGDMRGEEFTLTILEAVPR